MSTPVTLIRSNAILLTLLAYSCGISSAATLYSNLGSGGSFDANDYQIDVEADIGVSFIASQTATLDRIRIAVNWFQGPNTFTIILATTVGGLPGSTIESWDTTPTTNAFPSAAGLVSLNSSTHPLLTAGVRYWVLVTSGADETLDSSTQSHAHWYRNNTGAEGIAYRERDNAAVPWPAYTLFPNDDQAAFDVTGTPASAVPEPSSIGMGLVGIGALFAGRKWASRG